jgi:gamma-glutamyl-gamma-aminobutyraldehyde dehydrogenase
VIKVAETIKVGDPLDPATRFGAMVSEEQLNTTLRFITTARKEGNRLVMGGQRVREETGGYYVEPTIFDDVGTSSTLAQQEVFGPVLGVMTFKDSADAIRVANDTVYGLAAGLWTANVDRAIGVARALRAGLVWVNGWDSCDITMPFGGFKQSGFGRDRSLHAMHKYADLKSITVTVRDPAA